MKGDYIIYVCTFCKCLYCFSIPTWCSKKDQSMDLVLFFLWPNPILFLVLESWGMTDSELDNSLDLKCIFQHLISFERGNKKILRKNFVWCRGNFSL